MSDELVTPNDLRSLIPEWFEPLDESEVREILQHCGPRAQNIGFVRGFYWPRQNSRSRLSVATPREIFYGNSVLIEADSLILCEDVEVVAFIPYAYITAVHLLRDTDASGTRAFDPAEFRQDTVDPN